MIRTTTSILVSLIITLGCAASASQAPPTSSPQQPHADTTRLFRAIWVTRMDYRTDADVRRIIEDCATLGLTDVIWQVRGQADAFYASDLEPWGRELVRDLPAKSATAGPGFDPLATAVEAAHERKLKLHAWVNVMPLWKGLTPPTDLKHPFNTHPEWRLADQNGVAQPLNDHYVIVNPVREDVQDHIVKVCRDLVTRYAIDGLHMDYVRFVSEKMDAKSIYPGDPASLKLFTAATGHAAVATKEEHAAFQGWKRSRITDLVRRIHDEAIVTRPGVEFSAAVWRRPEIARETYLQDAAKWLNDGTLDRALPMIYTDKDEQFGGDLAAWIAASPDRALCPGLGTYLHLVDQTPRQLEAARETGRTRGFAIFAYSSLFDTADPSQNKDSKSKFERSQRSTAIANYIRGLVPPASGSSDDR